MLTGESDVKQWELATGSQTEVIGKKGFKCRSKIWRSNPYQSLSADGLSFFRNYRD